MQRETSDIAKPSVVTEIENILGRWLDALQPMPPLTKTEMRESRFGEREEKHRGKS